MYNRYILGNCSRWSKPCSNHQANKYGIGHNTTETSNEWIVNASTAATTNAYDQHIK